MKDAKLPEFQLAVGFGDVETHFNARDWLQKALEAKGAMVTGKGMGMGVADVTIKLEGFAFDVTIQPIGVIAPSGGE